MTRSPWISALLIAAACGSSTKTSDEPKPGVLAVQTAVETGLVPVVVVRGEDHRMTLADEMAKWHVPAVSIAVFDSYRLVWAKTYGVADVSTGERATESTLFQAGSISKSVNALAVLTAVADGTLALDPPINTLLKSWKLPDNELTAKTPVTLRRLLSHTAGVTVHGFPGYEAGAALPTIVQVLDGTPPANTEAIRVDLAPGTEYRYSGGGITITQLALVDNLGQPYPTIVHDRVLEPLGMTDSTYEQPLPDARVAAAAAGTHADGTIVPGKRHVYPEMAAAGLWTTPTDLAKFFLELQLALAGKSTRISRDLAVQMTTEQDKLAHVGLGVFIEAHDGAVMFGHDGADDGFQAHAQASLEGGYGFVVMANSDNGFQVFREVERTIIAAMGWPGNPAPIDRVALTPAQRDRLVGGFHLEHGFPWSIAADGDGLALVWPLGAPVELVPTSPTTLVNAEDGVVLTLTDDNTISVSARGEEFDRATRVSAGAKEPLLELAAGRYDDALALWRDQLKRDPASAQRTENQLNLYGYQLLTTGRAVHAVEVLRAVAALFPESSNAYDSLGEAQIAVGKTADAIASYEASLAKLDADPRIDPADRAPRRKHAEEQLAKLRAR